MQYCPLKTCRDLTAVLAITAEDLKSLETTSPVDKSFASYIVKEDGTACGVNQKK